jgi:DNA-binding response OmpR family regulator
VQVKFLCCDDDAVVLDSIEIEFNNSFNELIFIKCGDVQEGLEQAEIMKFDFVLSKYEIKEKAQDGKHFYRELKKTINKDTPVILYSNEAQDMTYPIGDKYFYYIEDIKSQIPQVLSIIKNVLKKN